MSQVVTLPAGRVRSVRPLVGIDFGLRPFRKAERTKSSATQAANLTTSGAADRAGFFEQFFGFKRALEPGSGAFTLMSNDEDFVLPLINRRSRSGGLSGNLSSWLLPGWLTRRPSQAKRDDLATGGLSAGKSMGPHRARYSFLLRRSSECAGRNRHARRQAAEFN